MLIYFGIQTDIITTRYFREPDKVMENYESKLLALTTSSSIDPLPHISYGEMIGLLPFKTSVSYGKALKKLAEQLPFKIRNWPSFGEYVEDWEKVEVDSFNYHLFYCERGNSQLRERCSNAIDFSFYIFKSCFPAYSDLAIPLVKYLDPIRDQRLLLWLNKSSEIFHMYQVNQFFGHRALTENVAWMCEELVRMGLFTDVSDAFKSKTYIIKGLSLSGLSGDFSNKLYRDMMGM